MAQSFPGSQTVPRTLSSDYLSALTFGPDLRQNDIDILTSLGNRLTWELMELLHMLREDAVVSTEQDW